MRALAAPPKGVVVCAISFDEEVDAFAHSALGLAERFDMELRFVNVLEAFATDPWVLDMPTNYVALPLYRETQAKLIGERRALLRALIDRLGASARIMGEVVSGDTADAIIAYAKLHRANLIVTTAGPRNYRFVPTALSTSMTLMAEAPLPVLIMSQERRVDFKAPSFRLMLADDLEPSTSEAARRTFELAAHLDGSVVRHLHVHGDFRELIRDSWLDWTSRYPALTSGAESPEALLDAEYHARLDKLAAQGLPYRDRAIEAGVTVQTDVRLGRVQEQIDDAIKEFDPHLLVFGRHRLFRTRPFLMGRMPTHAMLAGRRSVLLVPPAEALYANLPFPAAPPQCRAVSPAAMRLVREAPLPSAH